MLYGGIDIHKKYSVMSVINERGECLETKRFENNRTELQEILDRYKGEKFKAVIEAGLNWGVMYDMLWEMEGIVDVKLANASKVKAIASGKIKTDKIDSKILGQMLRMDYIPEVWVPDNPTRVLREVARYRLFTVKFKTMLKNRIHDILLKSHIEVPEVKDLFGSHGLKFLESLELKDKNYDILLKRQLGLLKQMKEEDKEIQEVLETELKDRSDIKLLRSIPGIGKIFGQLIALEISDIGRFANAQKLCSYCGLAPSIHSSGNTSYHGKLVIGNKWLRWAFIEASHSAINVSPYFKKHYIKVKNRAGTSGATISVARKLATVAYHVLKEKRDYIELLPDNKGRLPSDGASRSFTPDSFQV